MVFTVFRLLTDIEQNAVKFKIVPRKHESILNIFFANNERPPNNFVSMPLSHCHDTACFVAHSHILSTLSLCLESLRNRTPSNLKLPHMSKHRSWKEMAGIFPPPVLVNGSLCFSIPKHNGKSGTVCAWLRARDGYFYKSAYEIQNETSTT